jgi:UDP-N-acetyl-D-glucosamine dehydrogenase
MAQMSEDYSDFVFWHEIGHTSDQIRRTDLKSSLATRLLERLRSRQANVGVVGLGYVGLPLAVEFARSGLNTVGIDLDGRKVAAIERGQSYIPDVPASEIAPLVAAGSLRATTDFSFVKELDTVNICVPTPLRKTKDPDMSYIVSAVEAIADHLHPGMLIVLESTTYPGTTEEVVQPLLERSGLKAGRDFFLAFSPERVDPGNGVFTTRNVPKVVGGMTPTCAELAGALYNCAVDTIVPVSSPRVAEMVKLLENTFRAVNIGLVNEIALMCDKLGIDVWEVIDAAKTKPFGFMPFYPGPGLGGHCIPIDPFYLSWKAKQNGFEARFIELAGYVNGSMPHFVVDKIAEALNGAKKSVNGSRVLVVGIAYKRDIDDIRESPALDVMAVLKEKGARVSYSDPFVPSLSSRAWPGALDLHSTPLDAATLAGFDCVAILTDHKTVDYKTLVAASPLIVDTRNTIKQSYPHVFRLGAPRPADAVETTEHVTISSNLTV